jgi:hypothetical protein
VRAKTPLAEVFYFLPGNGAKNQHGPEAKIHLDKKINIDLNANQGENKNQKQ